MTILQRANSSVHVIIDMKGGDVERGNLNNSEEVEQLYTPKEIPEMGTTLAGKQQVQIIVDVWSPHSGPNVGEVNEMIDLLHANKIEVNVVPIRDLYQAELHVDFEEYVGIQGVKKYLSERVQG